jgi:hypothetical protein
MKDKIRKFTCMILGHTWFIIFSAPSDTGYVAGYNCFRCGEDKAIEWR